jgi:hypothetical protein
VADPPRLFALYAGGPARKGPRRRNPSFVRTTPFHEPSLGLFSFGPVVWWRRTTSSGTPAVPHPGSSSTSCARCTRRIVRLGEPLLDDFALCEPEASLPTQPWMAVASAYAPPGLRSKLDAPRPACTRPSLLAAGHGELLAMISANGSYVKPAAPDRRHPRIPSQITGSTPFRDGRPPRRTPYGRA